MQEVADADAKRQIASSHHQHSQGYHHGIHFSHHRGEHNNQKPVEVYKEISNESIGHESNTIIPVESDSGFLSIFNLFLIILHCLQSSNLLPKINNFTDTVCLVVYVYFIMYVLSD